MAYGDYQDEIYIDGLRGVMPRFPMTYDELEPLAQAALAASVRSYVMAGASTTSAPSGPTSPRSNAGASSRG